MAGHRGQKVLTRFRGRTRHEAICGHRLVRLRPDGHDCECRLAHGTRAGSVMAHEGAHAGAASEPIAI